MCIIKYIKTIIKKELFDNISHKFFFSETKMNYWILIYFLLIMLIILNIIIRSIIKYNKLLSDILVNINLS